jgi:hypothetical protein
MIYNNKNFNYSESFGLHIKTAINHQTDLIKYIYDIYDFSKNDKSDITEHVAFIEAALIHLFFVINPAYNDYIFIKLFMDIYFFPNTKEWFMNTLANIIGSDNKKHDFQNIVNKYFKVKNYAILL